MWNLSESKEVAFRQTENSKEGSERELDRFELKDGYIDYLKRRYDGGEYFVKSSEYNNIEDYLTAEYRVEDDKMIDSNKDTITLYLRNKECELIKEQRLLHHRQSDPFNTDPDTYEIKCIAEEVKALFSRAQDAFAAKSQKVDSTFIHRLIRGYQTDDATDIIKTRLQGLSDRVAKYKKYGLTSGLEIINQWTDKWNDVVSLYIDDMEAKLDNYKAFFEKLSLLDTLVSGKELSDKKIKLDGKQGLSVINHNFERIPLDKLSSGEQNLIILDYTLAFKTKRKSLLLIDEPENSLHMAWISTMLKDYIEMARVLDCQIILATHSPALIDERWDLTEDLFENGDGNEDGES